RAAGIEQELTGEAERCVESYGDARYAGCLFLCAVTCACLCFYAAATAAYHRAHVKTCLATARSRYIPAAREAGLSPRMRCLRRCACFFFFRASLCCRVSGESHARPCSHFELESEAILIRKRRNSCARNPCFQNVLQTNRHRCP
ncbi:unnamed protein product, partial [Ectocarpus sp. 12 AP-2014]